MDSENEKSIKYLHCDALRFSKSAPCPLSAVSPMTVDVSDTWSGDICGPPFIGDYAKQAPAAKMYDMMYFPDQTQDGKHPTTIDAIKRLHTQDVQSSSVGFGFGAPPLPGHENSTCESCSANAPKPWLPGCATYKNCCGQRSIGECCGCWVYPWNRSSTRAMIDVLEANQVDEIIIWRGDNAPQPGTSGGVPDWFMGEMKRIVARGAQR